MTLIETIESDKQKEDRLTVIEKQLQSLLMTFVNMKNQQQTNAVAQSLFSSSGMLKEASQTLQNVRFKMKVCITYIPEAVEITHVSNDTHAENL